MGTDAGNESALAGKDLQVQFLDVGISAVKVQVRQGDGLAGEALVLTFNKDTFLLATLTWFRLGFRLGDNMGADVATQKQHVYEALVREAADLAERHGAVLIAIVGPADVLIERGFEQNGSVWRLAPT